MKLLLAATATSVLFGSVALADPVWRWTTSSGALHYSNQRELAPASAEIIDTTPAVVQRRHADTDPLLADVSLDRAPSEPRPVTRNLHRIYDAERLRFGCYAGGVLAFGGWSHADDISGSIGCYRYLLGPDAWLNTARAELAVREHGISPRELYRMYRSEQR